MEALAVLERLSVSARRSIVVPYELVTVGSDWEAYRLALAHWIARVSPTLEDGWYDIGLPNTDLTCRARRESTQPPVVVLSRSYQEDESLAQRVGLQIAQGEEAQALQG